jgi:hypothetical protein
MKILQFTPGLFILFAFFSLNEADAQWNTSGNNIYNTNTANVGIGNSAPTTLLHVARSMTEPTITVQNLGGAGGATYRMTDNVSGADWKFKATNTGGFKIRDNANGLDVFVIESNSSASSIYIDADGSIGIGTATPDNSAVLDMSSTAKGFLAPRMTLVQIGAIVSPANGLIVFCTDDDKFYAYIAAANAWKELLFGSGTITPPSSCGDPIIINHEAGNAAPVTKTVTYNTVTNIPGEPAKCWITSNLGADQQASSVSDNSEASAGWYWQFNQMQGYQHDGSERTPNSSWTTTINEDSEWLPANDPCTQELGIGWRLPTSSEWTNVDASGGWTNWSSAWDSDLKLHAAGHLYDNSGSLGNRGIDGHYWSSSQLNSANGWYLVFHSSECGVYNYFKAYGFSARCLKN